MQVNKKTLNAIAKIITGGKPGENFKNSPYRKGWELVDFFKEGRLYIN